MQRIASLLKTYIKGNMEERLTAWRARQAMLNWMVTGGCRELKVVAQQRQKWQSQTFELA